MTTAAALRDLIFERLYAEYQGGEGSPTAFVGLQGDAIVVLGTNGERLVVTVAAVPASGGF